VARVSWQQVQDASVWTQNIFLHWQSMSLHVRLRFQCDRRHATQQLVQSIQIAIALSDFTAYRCINNYPNGISFSPMPWFWSANQKQEEQRVKEHQNRKSSVGVVFQWKPSTFSHLCEPAVTRCAQEPCQTINGRWVWRRPKPQFFGAYKGHRWMSNVENLSWRSRNYIAINNL
jgi:hypothetical protein